MILSVAYPGSPRHDDLSASMPIEKIIEFAEAAAKPAHRHAPARPAETIAPAHRAISTGQFRLQVAFGLGLGQGSLDDPQRLDLHGAWGEAFAEAEAHSGRIA